MLLLQLLVSIIIHNSISPTICKDSKNQVLKDKFFKNTNTNIKHILFSNSATVPLAYNPQHQTPAIHFIFYIFKSLNT